MITIGIDTGGTYTDSVIYDDKQGILSVGKALTTKGDLSVGILNSLDMLDPVLIHKAAYVCLSTTLATNACVEGKGGRAKLIFIGVQESVCRKYGPKSGLSDFDDILFLKASTSIDGSVYAEPDWDSFISNNDEFLSTAESLAIVEIHAMKNGAVLEEKCKELVKSKYQCPVICGHELFSDLDSLVRGASSLLNGRLIPVLAEFLDSIKLSLKARDINVPVAIVRSDATIMSEMFTGVRPVETVICGPTASVMGASSLVSSKNCVVVDMGGTTTDICLIRDGAPVCFEDGVNIGQWKTYVKGVFVETCGLGGDSAIRFTRYGIPYVDTERVIPLCVLQNQYPYILESLRELLAEKENHTRFLHEFYVLVKDISSSDRYSDFEKEFCNNLKNGPVIYTQAAESVGKDIYTLNVDRLIREGVIVKSGLTPTDLMHIRGDFRIYDYESSELALSFVASSCSQTPDEMMEWSYNEIKRKLYYNIVSVLLKDKYPFLRDGIGDIGKLIDEAWKNERSTIAIDFTPDLDLVGVGAPIHVFLYDVAERLGMKCIIPEHSDVVNAAGAATGRIRAKCTVDIRNNDYGFKVISADGVNFVKTIEEAFEIAKTKAASIAEKEARRRGAVNDVEVSVFDSSVTIRTGYASQIYRENSVTAVASGGIN